MAPQPNNGAYWPAPHGYPVDRGSRNPLITEVACQGGTLASLHPLPLDEPHTPQSVLMSARGKATRWWITMRSTELALPFTLLLRLWR